MLKESCINHRIFVGIIKINLLYIGHPVCHEQAEKRDCFTSVYFLAYDWRYRRRNASFAFRTERVLVYRSMIDVSVDVELIDWRLSEGGREWRERLELNGGLMNLVRTGVAGFK